MTTGDDTSGVLVGIRDRAPADAGRRRGNRRRERPGRRRRRRGTRSTGRGARRPGASWTGLDGEDGGGERLRHCGTSAGAKAKEAAERWGSDGDRGLRSTAGFSRSDRQALRSADNAVDCDRFVRSQCQSRSERIAPASGMVRCPSAGRSPARQLPASLTRGSEVRYRLRRLDADRCRLQSQAAGRSLHRASSPRARLRGL